MYQKEIMKLACTSMLLTALVLVGCKHSTVSNSGSRNSLKTSTPGIEESPNVEEKITLFDGSTLEGWKKTNFGGCLLYTSDAADE